MLGLYITMKSLQEQLGEIKKVLEVSKSKEPERKNLKKPSQAKNVIVAGKEYKVCPECGCRLRPSRFNRHLLQQHGYAPKQHSDTIKQTALVGNDSEFTICPDCNKAVKKKNLKKHIRRIHEKKKFNAKNNQPNKGKPKKSRAIPLPAHRMTPEDAAELRKAMEETHLVQNREIEEYLKKNPSKDGMGKFGVPQDKYRWGFYGSKSMEYDIWGKGDKNK